jgi:hypothetical protein
LHILFFDYLKKMHISEFGGVLLVLGFAILTCNADSDDGAEVHIVSSGYCSKEVLRRKGVDVSKYVNKVIFDPKKIKTIPAKPTVPGCFRLIAQNVTIKEHMTQVTAEFEMRVSGDADPSKPILQCKKRQPKCGCGEKDTCMYCDFCKNFKKMVKDGTINNKEIDFNAAKGTCECNVPTDTYNIDAEVCTPDAGELAENVPAEVLNYVTDGKDFSLFTTLYIYDFRFNSLATSDNSQAATGALKSRKARGLVGCYIVGSNVSV